MQNANSRSLCDGTRREVFKLHYMVHLIMCQKIEVILISSGYACVCFMVRRLIFVTG